jgi:hypothetical protein
MATFWVGGWSKQKEGNIKELSGVMEIHILLGMWVINECTSVKVH